MFSLPGCFMRKGYPIKIKIDFAISLLHYFMNTLCKVCLDYMIDILTELMGGLTFVLV